MSRSLLRRFAIALGALMLVLALATAVLVARFDANHYKSLAVDWVQAQHQRQLAIDGPIGLSLFPRLGLELSGLRLSERGGGAEFLAADEAALAVRLLPLLRGELVVERISARGLRARIERGADGRSNIDDLLGGAADGNAPTGRPASALPEIAGVQLADLRLQWRDQRSGAAGELTLEELRAGRIAPGVDTPVNFKLVLALAPPRPARLALDGQLSLRIDAGSRDISFSALAIDAQGEASAFRLRPSTLRVGQVLIQPASAAIELQRLDLGITGAAGAQGFELALAWPQLTLQAERVSSSALTGRYALKGPLALAGDLQAAAATGDMTALRLPEFSLSAAGSAGARRFEGRLTADLLLRPNAAGAAIEPLALNATVTDPGLPALALQLQGRADLGADLLKWALQGKLDGERLVSAGQADLSAAVPAIRAQAQVDRIDLNRWLAPGQPVASGPAAADTAIDLAGLRAVDGEFQLGAGALAWRQYRVDAAALEATLNGGKLQVQRLAGRAWGGKVLASGSAEAGAQHIAIKLTADGVDVNALLRDVAGKDLLEGRGRVVADLQTQGDSLGALRSQLAGSAAMQLRDGAVKGINLARSMRQAQAALSGRQDALSQASATEKTDFTELSASARITGGVARSDDLALKSPYLRIGGAGQFDIGRGRIDYTARATVTGSPAGQDGKALAALRGVTVPVELRGPFGAIEWKIQWSGVAAAALQNRLQDKIAEKLGGRPKPQDSDDGAAPATPKDKLKDALRGFFR